MPKDFRSIANIYNSRMHTHSSSKLAKQRQKQVKNNSTQIIAGPFFVYVLHHCQHQTPQSYRGDKVIYHALIVICQANSLILQGVGFIAATSGLHFIRVRLSLAYNIFILYKHIHSLAKIVFHSNLNIFEPHLTNLRNLIKHES